MTCLNPLENSILILKFNNTHVENAVNWNLKQHERENLYIYLVKIKSVSVI